MSNILISRDPIPLGPLIDTFDPQDFFSNKNSEVSLCVWHDFKSRLLSSASPVTNQPALAVSVHDLTKNMCDREIRDELPPTHVFSVDDLWIIGSLLKLQPRGEAGTLLNNSSVNIFYVRVGDQVFVVGVNWNRGTAKWYVNAWRLDENDQWFGGFRVLSRN